MSDVCPVCGADLEHDREQPPWCPACEWNLVERSYREDDRPSRSVRRSRAQAFGENERMLAELRTVRPGRPVTTRSRVLISIASAFLLVAQMVLVAGGAYLLVTANIAIKLLGLLALLIGVECRLRIPRLPTRGGITAEQAPHLFAAIDRVRVAVGGPAIDIVVLGDEFNAYCGRTGLRRRVVLGIGLPLWGALSPAGRVALLGHELGHLVNGDPTTSFTSQLALVTCGRLARLFHPRGIIAAPGAEINLVVIPLSYLILGLPYLFFRWAHLSLLRIGRRDHQRAEIYADALAVELAGSAAAAELIGFLLFGRVIRGAIQRAAIAGSADPRQWRSAAASALAAQVPGSRRAQQVSRRMAASAYSTHPPAGLRLRLVESWPACPARLELSETEIAAVDAELRDAYEQTRRDLAAALAA